jgi:ABC-type transport system involved in cytochrome c biogenesis permease subunit
MSLYARTIPWVLAGAGVIYLLMCTAAGSDRPDGWHLQEFGRLPVGESGRVMPVDTLARNSLMIISGRQEFADPDGKQKSAVQWLLEVMTSGGAFKQANDQHQVFTIPAEKAKVFRIENDQVLDLLGLEPRSKTHFRYAIDEFRDKIDQLAERATRARKIESKQRSLFETKLIELAEHLELYIKLSSLQGIEPIPPSAGNDWLTFHAALIEQQKTGEQNPALMAWGKMLFAYAHGDRESFNRELTSYRESLAKLKLEETDRTDFEAFFNEFAPFSQCGWLYVGVFLLACLSWLGWTEPLNRSAFLLAIVTLAVHSWALLARMYLTGRWFVFVTNLYSSAVFIGWGCVVLGLILELIYRNGLGTVLAAALGSLTMLVAHHMASAGDTLGMLQAVLDTNFWLATHVTCVTMGYTATFVAGFLGILFILRGVLTRSLDQPTLKVHGQMIYGIICFATLFSFVGTVLGGLWADYSWGRFWGWDPKENGALLIVIMNALILHARWGGLVKQAGMAVLAVCGNMVTGWSWFGTNQLGVGLHAYGFNNTLANGLTIFWLSQLAVIGMGLLPLSYWQSFRHRIA